MRMRGVRGRARSVLQEPDGFVEAPHVIAAVKGDVVVPLTTGPALMRLCVYAFMRLCVYEFMRL
jgi:hypothetical protein